jgi:4-hydroxy-tetrahydrodipicolinate reductase
MEPANMSTPALRVAVCGATGRMGQMLIAAVDGAADCVLSAALEHAQSPALGNRVGKLGVAVSADVAQALAASDVLIDFTRPEGTMAHLTACAKAKVALVIGTTGFEPEQKAQIAEAAQHIGVVMAPNMSVGVNVTFKLLELAAKAMPRGYDIEIIEAHHRHKVDAPSGTALKMGEVIANALGRNLADCAVYAREGVTGERDPNTIGFAAVRGGDIVGDHTVMWAGTGERIEISHKANSRQGYAQGSLQAARFLRNKPKGLFDMFDVLGLNTLGQPPQESACSA